MASANDVNRIRGFQDALGQVIVGISPGSSGKGVRRSSALM